MKILVNYTLEEKQYLPLLVYQLKGLGIEAVGTYAQHKDYELVAKAQANQCAGILLCNPHTLANLVSAPKPTLDAFRGSRIPLEVPAIVCNSLSHLVSVPHGEWLLQQDLKKFSSIRVPTADFDFTPLDTYKPFEWASALANLKKCLLVAVDVETAYLNEEEGNIEGGDSIITSCSWSGLMPDGTILTYVLPLIDFGYDHWTDPKHYAAAIQFMQRANSIAAPKAMHNGMYDSTQLIRYHAEPNNWAIDTMGIAHSTFSELPKDLAFVSSLHLHDYYYWKYESDLASKNKDIYSYWRYNALDTFNTLRVAIQQLRTMPAYAKRNYAEQFPLVYPCLYCSFEGILIDNDKRLPLRAAAEAKLEEARRQLRLMVANSDFNPGSWQQVEFYIYNIFGATKPKIGKSKSCTDEKNLIAVGEQHPLLSRVTSHILDYREAQKAIGTYFDFKQKNSRLLYALDPFGTETSRMACKSSSLWVGTQAQNVPKYAKGMLVADPGYTICEVDNSQSEARCTAYCSQETGLISALESATHDFYKTLGTLFFNIPYEQVSDFFRNKVLKKIVHGTNYMMGAKTFIENIGTQILYETAAQMGLILTPHPNPRNPKELTLQAFAKSLLEAYHKPFPRVREWYKELYNEILTTGYLVGPLGNTRRFFGNIAKDHNMLRGAVAHQPQNLSVAILNKGFRKVYRELVIPSKGKFRLKAQVHDSILSQFPADEAHIWVPKKQALMYNPVVIHGRTLVIPTEAELGPNWKDKEKFHS